MKKILLALALILSVTMVSAQPKTPADAQKAIDKALANTQNEKKAAKSATWIKLADAYLDAYDLPTKNLLLNTPQMEVKLFLKGQQVLNNETRKGTEGEYSVDVYQDKELFYNQNGLLEFWVVTKPVVEGDILGIACDALIKAAELDSKGSSFKDIYERFESIHQKQSSEAVSQYLIGNFALASKLFENSLKSYDNSVVKKVDSLNVYHTALLNGFSGNKEKAIEYYKKCLDISYYSDGSVYSNLADMYKQSGNIELCKSTLEAGFAKFPSNQGILVGLINLLIETGDSPQALFDLLHTAQKNEPTNASLYYVEGDVYKKLGDNDNAIKYFSKATEIDPNYVFGILGVGILHYDIAVDLQNKAAEEVDDSKYMALIKEFEESLEAAIDPFEKSFVITDDPQIKQAIAEYLKNIYFRFRDKSEEYKAAYEKYNNYLKQE